MDEKLKTYLIIQFVYQEHNELVDVIGFTHAHHSTKFMRRTLQEIGGRNVFIFYPHACIHIAQGDNHGRRYILAVAAELASQYKMEKRWAVGKTLKSCVQVACVAQVSQATLTLSQFHLTYRGKDELK